MPWLPPVACPQSPKNRLELHEGREGGVYVKGLNTFVVKSEAEIAAVLEVGGWVGGVPDGQQVTCSCSQCWQCG